MKLLILADSHGDIGAIPNAVKRDQPDMMIHLGDHTSDALALRDFFPDIPLHIVRGNCDYSGGYADMELLEICGRKVFITHGHLYGVKNGLDKIIRKGEEIDADLVLFGHTHTVYIGQSKGAWLFNPGTAGGKNWGGGTRHRKTYGVAELDKDVIRCEIREVPPVT